ncbi:hypothetical protein H6F86_31390 [Phormidium sp. FACHB-592]|uniref:hypothetical protein n=1 Tax=Cyanophyceae TaxID=3028117 RepID=UPI001686FB7B|nr:hypothetical protein [Phormidium sp. FACHB-592]MBD2078314.1 hypothetical protein [Phormidium sp. FACHB-592]
MTNDPDSSPDIQQDINGDRNQNIAWGWCSLVCLYGECNRINPVEEALGRVLILEQPIQPSYEMVNSKNQSPVVLASASLQTKASGTPAPD